MTTQNEGGNTIISRRMDHHLRKSIAALQNLLFDPCAHKEIYSTAVKELITLTQSDLGIIIETSKYFLWTGYRIKTPIQSINDLSRFHQHQKSILTPLNKSNFSLDGAQMIAALGQAPMTKQPFVLNGNIPAKYLTPFISDSNWKSMLIAPILKSSNVAGIAVLLKRSDLYSDGTINRITPLIDAACYALTSTSHLHNITPMLDTGLQANGVLNSLITASPAGIIIVDENNFIAMANTAVEGIFGAPNNGMLGKRIQKFIPDYDSLFQWPNRSNLSPHTPKLPKRINASQKDLIAHRPNGEEFFIRLSLFRFKHNETRYTTLQILEITATASHTHEKPPIWQQFNALTHLIPLGIIQVDKNWNCIYANDTWFTLSGLNADETNGEGWVNALHPEDYNQVLEGLRGVIQDEGDYQKEFRLRSPLGKVCWVDMHASALYSDDGHLLGFLASFTNITNRLKIQEKLRIVAEFDNLTGLPNRNLFQDRLQQAFRFSERQSCDIAVLFIDLDGFKDVNDTYGHDKGDELLTMAGERFLNALRASDTVARFGGDEFAILLGGDTTSHQLESVAQKLISTIQKPFILQDEEVFVTTSIGIAVGRANTHTPQLLMKQADIAMYRAKHEGKNKFRFFSTDLDKESRLRVHMIKCLRSAVEKEQFTLAYQPQACVNTGRIMGVEILLRWDHEELGNVPPTNFIPLLEDTSLIKDVGYWIIDTAFAEIYNWRKNGKFPLNATVSINISPRQFSDDNLAQAIQELALKNSIPPELIVCEITESMLIKKADQAREILQNLRDFGIKIALDDFGTGYSSLSYLQQFPIDQIKIDQSFVRDILTDTNDAKITHAIISLSKSLGLEVLAEGVESDDCLTMLKTFGCDYYQGYFLSRPQNKYDVFTSLA